MSVKTKFEVWKTYSTTGGGTAKIYSISQTNEKYPLWGWVNHPEGGGQTEPWTSEGRCWWNRESGHDLIIGEEAPARE